MHSKACSMKDVKESQFLGKPPKLVKKMQNWSHSFWLYFGVVLCLEIYSELNFYPLNHQICVQIMIFNLWHLHPNHGLNQIFQDQIHLLILLLMLKQIYTNKINTKTNKTQTKQTKTNAPKSSKDPKFLMHFKCSILPRNNASNALTLPILRGPWESPLSGYPKSPKVPL